MKITLGLASLATLSCLAEKNSRPNIVFILTDDQNTNTVGCYEHTVSTPNIDYLAKNGIKFNNANVVSTVSSPSRYALLTGRYYNSNYSKEFLSEYPTGTTSCIGNDCFLENDQQNLAGILRKSGYTTGFVGKFHLTEHKLLTTQRLWEESGLKMYPANSDPRIDQETNEKLKYNHQYWCNKIANFGFDYVNGVYAANLRELFNEHLNAHNVEWTMDAALKFLDMQKKSKKPFMLWMATTYPHGPAPHVLKNDKYLYSLDADPTLTGEGVRPDLKGEYPSRKEIISKYKMMKAKNPDLSETAITALWWDEVVGKVISKLKELGIEDNTIIVYTSDHGILNGGKTTLYNGATNVPLIIQWKNGIAKRLEYNHIVGSIDLAPTLMDIAGINLSEQNVDGVSLKPMLNNVSLPVRDALLMEMGYARAVKTDSLKYIAIRYPEKIETKCFDKEKGHYAIMKHAQLSTKAVKARPNYFQKDQIYDFIKDPLEKKNVFGISKENDEYMKALMKREVSKYSNRPFGEFNR